MAQSVFFVVLLGLPQLGTALLEMDNMRTLKLLALAPFALALACGGGGSDQAPPATPSTPDTDAGAASAAPADTSAAPLRRRHLGEHDARPDGPRGADGATRRHLDADGRSTPARPKKKGKGKKKKGSEQAPRGSETERRAPSTAAGTPLEPRRLVSLVRR